MSRFISRSFDRRLSRWDAEGLHVPASPNSSILDPSVEQLDELREKLAAPFAFLYSPIRKSATKIAAAKVAKMIATIEAESEARIVAAKNTNVLVSVGAYADTKDTDTLDTLDTFDEPTVLDKPSVTEITVVDDAETERAALLLAAQEAAAEAAEREAHALTITQRAQQIAAVRKAHQEAAFKLAQGIEEADAAAQIAAVEAAEHEAQRAQQVAAVLEAHQGAAFKLAQGIEEADAAAQIAAAIAVSEEEASVTSAASIAVEETVASPVAEFVAIEEPAVAAVVDEVALVDEVPQVDEVTQVVDEEVAEVDEVVMPEPVAAFQTYTPRTREPREEGLSKHVRILIAVAVAAFVFAAMSMGTSKPAAAQVADVDPGSATATGQTPTTIASAPTTTIVNPTGPKGPAGPSGQSAGTASINLNLNDALNKPSQSILIIILITVLSVAPALLIMLTSFTRIIIVLTLTRNALGIQTIPPNQVLVGLALFLSLFIMGPTFSAMNKDAVQPYMAGKINQQQAYNAGVAPLKTYMLKQTRQDELQLFITASKSPKPAKPEDVGMEALVPAYILSEMKTAFIIGFVVFIPFLVIDIIVSSSLMSMGMMMLPPQMISMPFKLLLFVLVDGWGLVIRSLLTSFNS